MRYRKTIISGDVLEIEEYTTHLALDQCCPRGGKQEKTDDVKAEANRRNSLKKLCRLINANFGEGDLFVTLTHAEEIGATAADKELTNFLRRLKRYRKKENLPPLKYIGVTESGARREHHHLIVNAISRDAIDSLWGKGRAMTSRIEPGGDYTGLAIYITKDQHKPGKRRWRQSKNLKKPEVTVKKLKSNKVKKLYPPKGYVTVESYEYYSQWGGAAAYLKAVRSGGCDIGGNLNHEPMERYRPARR